MEQKIEVFEHMPIPKAVATNAIPAIISMLVVLAYNIADTFFVGQTGDPLQVAAVSIVTPVFLLFMATGNLLGIGGTSAISRALGGGKQEYARKISSFCFYASITAGCLFMIVFWTHMSGILNSIGTSVDTINYARNYLNWIALSAPFAIVATAFSNIVRAEGKSTQAMIGNMLGTIVNIILDPVMILWMNMGVTGAAVATVIGNIVGAVYYGAHFLRNRSILSISIRDFQMRGGVCSSVLAIGIPASLNNVLMSSSHIIMNNLLATYGDIQLAAMAVAMKVHLIVVLLLIGLGQGIQPLLGYNFSSKDLQRVKGIMKFSLACSIVMGTVLTLICLIGTGPIVRAFIDNEAVYEYGVAFVKALMISGPSIGILFVFTNALQAMGAAIPSLFLSIGRQGLIFIPLLFLLNALH